MEAMKVMAGRKDRERDRSGEGVVVLKVVGVRVEALLVRLVWLWEEGV